MSNGRETSLFLRLELLGWGGLDLSVMCRTLTFIPIVN